MMRFSKMPTQHPAQKQRLESAVKPRQPFFKRVMASMMASTLMALVGCAATPIKPSYVPATDYQSLNCEGLRAEHTRISAHIAQGVPEESRSLFSGMSFGLGAFGGGGLGWGWSPSISFSSGQQTTVNQAAHARLLGQREAVNQQGVLQGCPITVPAK